MNSTEKNSILIALEYYRVTEGTFEDWVNSYGTRSLENTFRYFKHKRENAFPEELFYYCSGFVAENIIGNGFVWLNDIRKMNDESEMVFAIEHLANRLSGMKKQIAYDVNLLEVFEESFLDITNNSIRRDNVPHAGKLILGMSLTHAKDDASMWERYAEKGRGVSVHFSTKKMSRIITSASIFFPNPLPFEHGISKICYAGEDCECLEKLYQEIIEAFDDAKSDEEKNVVRTLLHVKILELLVSHKHGSFSSEKEYRIFSRAPSEKTWSGSDHIHSHGKGNQKSLHSELFLPHWAINQSLDEFWNELIIGITLGPCASEDTKKSIKLALESRGIGDKLWISNCPLRCS